jgi:hypothetical protein
MSEFSKLNPAQQAAVRKAVADANPHHRATGGDIDGTNEYAWASASLVPFGLVHWGVANRDGDVVALGELKPGETLA